MEGGSVREFVEAIIFGLLVFLFLYVVLTAQGCNRYAPLSPELFTADCTTVYNHLISLDCAELITVPGFDELPNTTDDLDWIYFCKETQSGNVINMDLQCAMQSTTCAEIELCL